MNVAQQLRDSAAQRILIKDGAYGTQVQARRLREADYAGSLGLSRDQKGNNDLLNLTQPELVRDICQNFADAGAELLATNSFKANRISHALRRESRGREINCSAARIIAEVADREAQKDGRSASSPALSADTRRCRVARRQRPAIARSFRHVGRLCRTDRGAGEGGAIR